MSSRYDGNKDTLTIPQVVALSKLPREEALEDMVAVLKDFGCHFHPRGTDTHRPHYLVTMPDGSRAINYYPDTETPQAAIQDFVTMARRLVEQRDREAAQAAIKPDLPLPEFAQAIDWSQYPGMEAKAISDKTLTITLQPEAEFPWHPVSIDPFAIPANADPRKALVAFLDNLKLQHDSYYGNLLDATATRNPQHTESESNVTITLNPPANTAIDEAKPVTLTIEPGQSLQQLERSLRTQVEKNTDAIAAIDLAHELASAETKDDLPVLQDGTTIKEVVPTSPKSLKGKETVIS